MYRNEYEYQKTDVLVYCIKSDLSDSPFCFFTDWHVY